MLAACGNNSGNVDDLFISDGNNAGTADVREDVTATNTSSAVTANQQPAQNDSEVSMAQEPVMTEENAAMFEAATNRLTNVYGNNIERHETGAEIYELIHTDTGIISIMATPWGDFIGIYYGFDFDLEHDSLDELVERIATFVSTVLDATLEPEHITIIQEAVEQLGDDVYDDDEYMTEPIFIDFGYYFFTMVLMDNYMTIGTGW